MHSSLEMVRCNINDDYPDDRNDITHNSLTAYHDTLLDALFMVSYLIITVTLKGRYCHCSHITDEKT